MKKLLLVLTALALVLVTGAALADQLPEPGVEMQDRATVGDTVTITFGETDNATDYSYWIHPFNSQDPIANKGGSRSTPGDLTLDTTGLNPGFYKVECEASADGYDSSSTLRLLVLREANLQVDEYYFAMSANTMTTYSNDWSAVFYVPGAEKVSLWYSDADWLHEDRDEDTLVAYRDYWRYATTVEVYGQADTWNEPVCLGEVTVTAPNGQLDPPDVAMTDKAFVGDELIITFNEIQNATDYSYWIHPFDSNEGIQGKDGWRQDPGELILNTEGMEPGVYCVEFDVNAPGYQEGHSTLHLALLDHDAVDLSDGENYYFSMPSEDKLVREENWPVIFYVPGAQHVSLWYSNMYNDCDIPSDTDGPGLVSYPDWGNPMDVTVYGQADSWNEPVELGTFRMTAPEGALSAPDVWVPTMIGTNEDLVITFNSPVENANHYWYWYSLYNDEWGNLGGGDFWDTAENPAVWPVQFTIPAENLAPGSVYRVFLDANHTGYVEGHTERSVFVDGGAYDENITITAPESVLQSNPFNVSVNAPGADAIRILFSFGEEHEYEGDSINAEFSANWDVRDYGNAYWVYALAHKNGSWNHASRILQINVQNTGGSADNPTLTLDTTTATVTRGEFVKVSLSEISQEASDYRVWIEDENENWRDDFGRGNTAGEILIPTGKLEAGTYQVHGYVRAPGYLNGQSENDVFFIVTDDNQAKMVVDKTSVTVMEPIQVSVYDPAASRIRFSAGYDRWYGDEEEGWEGNSWSHNWISWDWSEDPAITIYAEGLHGDNWVRIGTKTIKVTNPNGRLPEPEIDLYQLKNISEGLDFTVHMPEGAGQYEVEVWAEYDGHHILDTGRLNVSESVCSYHIDSSELEAGVKYHVLVRVFGWGYHESENCVFAYVIDDNQDDSITIEAPASVLQNENFQVIISAPGAERVAVFLSPGVVDETDGDTGVWPFNADWDVRQCGNAYWITGLAYKNGVWTHATVEMPVVNNGVADDAPTLTLDSTTATVARGEFVKVSLSEVSMEALDYRVWIMDENENWQDDFSRGNTPGEILIPTSKLEAGTYRVHGYVRVIGYENCESGNDIYFTVTDDGQTKIMTVDKTSVVTTETVQLSVYDPDASRIRISRGYNEWWDMDNWESNWYYSLIGWDYHDDPAIIVKAEGMHNGQWVEIGQKTIKVTAPNGQLPEPDVDLYQLQNINDGLNFTVYMREEANQYEVEVWAEYDGHHILDTDRQFETRSFHIDPEDLEAGVKYHVLVRMFGWGYIESEKEVCVYVFDETIDDSITLETPAYVRQNENFQVIVSAPGAERVGIFLSPGVADETNEATGVWPFNAEWDVSEWGNAYWIFGLACKNGVWTHNVVEVPVIRQTLTLPAGLTEIEEEAFQGVAAQMVIIPDSVTSVGSGAFTNSSIIAAEVPGNLYIPDDAFDEGVIITRR